MLYSHENCESDVTAILEKCAALRAKKGNDYADADTLSNIRMCGSKGIVPRLGDKFNRLLQLVWHSKTAQVQDESIDDTIYDLINYAMFLKIMRDQEQAADPLNIPRLEK